MSEENTHRQRKQTRIRFRPITQRPAHSDLHRLFLLFTVVNRKKTEFYMDYIQTNFQVNMQMSLAASGTASTEIRSVLGLTDSEKSVIISVIRDDQAPLALKGLEEKFSTIKNGKGIAYTVPVSSTVGVAIYQFLANLPSANKRP